MPAKPNRAKLYRQQELPCVPMEIYNPRYRRLARQVIGAYDAESFKSPPRCRRTIVSTRPPVDDTARWDRCRRSPTAG